MRLLEVIDRIKLTHLHYFNVDQEDIAKQLGLKKDRKGNWYLPQYNTSGSGFDKKVADSIRIFGQPTRTLKIN